MIGGNLMSDSSGRHDYSWLTDIEKIQAEIAKDLEKTQPTYSFSDTPEEPAGHSERTDSTLESGYESMSESISAVWTDTTPESAEPINWTDLFSESEPWPADSAPPEPNALPAATSGFYRETIKVEPPSRRSWPKTVAVIILVCVFGMGSLGFGLGAAYTWATHRANGILPEETGNNHETLTITSSRYAFDIGDRQNGTIADMVALLEPAVVGITTRFEVGNISPIAGSGTIFAENEERVFIVTGDYVVPGRVGAQYSVRISGSGPIPARVVNREEEAGLAVVAVDKALLLEAGIDSVVVASFGDSSLMQVGDVVFAIGNARNEGNSVTRGIISAGKQEISFLGYTLTVLQTDAAINYGNSGGPLINLRGEVIGINIDRASRLFDSASVEGIGYSIASNVAVPIMEDLINPTRPALNISGGTLNEITAAYLGIPAMGVFVHYVLPGGAADEAGIAAGDIITAFGGEPVFTMEELIAAIRRRQIGDIVEVRVLRDGELLTMDAQLRALVE